MNWVGKLGGGVLGLLAGGPIGLVIGGILGHQFDRGLDSVRAPRVRAGARPRLDPAGERLYFESLFLVMGHLAKADGRVSEDEIAAARQAMLGLKLGRGRQRHAIEHFNRGKAADFPLGAQVARLRQLCRGQPQLSHAFLQFQLDFVLAKGHLARRERELLGQVAEGLGIGRMELAQMEAMTRARRGFARRDARPAQDDELAGACRVLGVDPTASEQEIKQAWRRLMSRHHPDKLAARGGSVADLAEAERRTREVLAAYETIRERRGLR